MKIRFTFRLAFFLFLINSLNVKGQNYYWGANNKITLEVDTTSIIVRAEIESEIENSLSRLQNLETIERINQNTLLIRLKPSFKSIEGLSSITGNLSYSFFDDSGHMVIPTGEILFMPKKGVSLNDINKLVGGQFEIVKEKYGSFRVFINEYKNLLSVSNKIYESGLVEYSHPNFIMELIKSQNDPLYPDQYYLNNTGQFGGNAGIDINAPQAWALGTGLFDVRVAVIDDGVENHPDLNGRVVQGFSPRNANGFGTPTAPSEHGQACAGIIGATRNNSEGVAGIYSCATIVPINIFVGNESTADIADAIDWAWDEGNADVLSNSWSYPSATVYYDNIAQAIGRARTLGRNGNGSVVVFSSGNYHPGGGEPIQFNGVAFPSKVTGVITVGAITNTGTIQGYSSRGPEMNLVAPSGGGNVRTTDRPGAPGYNGGNYTNTFGGTSAACPQVSGVAALMLSLNPNLTEQNLKNILHTTAYPMGPTGFDNTYGHGRLDAQKAVQSAMLPINGSNSICTTGTYTVANPAGTTVSWNVIPTNALSFSGGGSSKTFTRVNNFTGSVTIRATIMGSDANCEFAVLSKTVLVGTAITVTAPNMADASGGLSVSVSNGTGNYKYYKNGALLLSSGSPSVYLNWGCSGGLLKVTCNTNCGTSEGTRTIYQNCGSYMMAVYPNPSSSELFIVYDYEKSSDENGGRIRSVTEQGPLKTEIYDFYGNLIMAKQFEKSSNVPRINISDLKQATYFLRIIGKEIDEVHQIIKE
ncbi:S8 family serine peptidase [Maribacter aurantiacus]|uniref:T9SS type A sorting domain-containing protein n=1 Tax=Maribacter aurantiacus TaxID=1882343 RepID=A0A5R8M4K9_9FLAO|nr:S8 family serine peptidase [Maribacter aurantiacus]TLF44465.1 T9SS type A sorting domain-containing protein [Maribacter aurantiacus]